MAIVANPNNNNITGARCAFILNGQVIAYARSVSFSYEISYSENRVLNNLRAESHSPQSYRVSLSFSLFRVPGQTLTTLGFFPKTGANPSEQIANVLSIPELTAVVVDQVSGLALATFTGVKIASGNFSIDAGGGVVATQVDCVCISMVEEGESSAA